MMAIAAVVPHYLLGLAAGAAVLGCFMPIAGYIIPVANIPSPFWRYPMHYLGYHTYSMNGLMANEFVGTDGWGCPCELQKGGCATPNCTITGEEVRIPISLYRDLFLFTSLSVRDRDALPLWRYFWRCLWRWQCGKHTSKLQALVSCSHSSCKGVLAAQTRFAQSLAW
jgi:hypothetical protein